MTEDQEAAAVAKILGTVPKPPLAKKKQLRQEAKIAFARYGRALEASKVLSADVRVPQNAHAHNRLQTELLFAIVDFLAGDEEDD